MIHTRVAGAGRVRVNCDQLARRLGADVAVSTAPGDAERLAAESTGYDRVIAAGGDGTVHEVLCGLMRRDGGPAALGILPLGTGNDVARNLGLVTVDDGLTALAAGDTRAMDVLRLTLRRDGEPVVTHAALNCGIGYSAEVIRATTLGVKRLAGPRWAYTVGTFRALVRWRNPTFRLRWDDGEETARVLWLGVGNGEWEGAGTMRVSPGARLDDGLMNVLIAHHGPKLTLVRNFGGIATGAHVHHPLCRYFTCTWLEAEAVDGPYDGQVELQSDGNILGRTPVRVELVPAGIRVIAPESAA